jgi:hypothetical protein
MIFLSANPRRRTRFHRQPTLTLVGVLLDKPGLQFGLTEDAGAKSLVIRASFGFGPPA